MNTDTNISLLNDIFRIKKLFTEAYYDYRFSSLFIKSIDCISKMIIPADNYQRYSYNDENKFIEFELKSPANIDKYVDDILSSFILFCYDDQKMREILYLVNPDDFKVFDITMKAISDAKALGLTNSINERFLAANIFNVLVISSTLVRVNLM